MTKSNHVVVIGGSIAGLLAARVLSNHFENVTIIERDKLPEDQSYRSGTPQARHLHLLLSHGEMILEEMFPGFGKELESHGVPRLTWGLDTRTLTKTGWLPITDLGLVGHSSSRNTLEYVVRNRVRNTANVTFLAEHDVFCPLYENGRVIGVQVRSRVDRTEQNIMADLVVDASGRGSKAPEWLESIGYETPEDTVVNSYLGYATRWYTMPEGFDTGWVTMAIQARPNEDNLRYGGAFIVEDNQLVVTLAGTNKIYPPTDEEGFNEFMQQIPSTAIWDVVKQLEPSSPIYGYRRTASRQRHFERLPQMPEGFIVLGDAACCFNPIYGQGMTTAALEVRELQKLLETVGAETNGFSMKFQQALAGAVKNAWLMATGEDLRYPLTEGKQPNFMERATQRYIDAVFEAMPQNVELSRAFVRVMNLMDDPIVLFKPQFILATLRNRAA